MKRASRIPFLFCLLLVVSACGGGGSDAVINDPGGTLSASFAPNQPNPGNLATAMAPGGSSGALMTVAVVVANTNDVYGAALVVTFDPAKASYQGWTHGTLLETGGQSPTYQVDASVPGTVIVGATRNGNVVGVDVSGVRGLINLTFRVTAAGTSAVDFDIPSSVLYNSNAPPEPIPGVVFSGGVLQAS